jgi:hypothetical protein
VSPVGGDVSCAIIFRIEIDDANVSIVGEKATLADVIA